MLPSASASHCFVQNAALPHKWGHCKQSKLNPLSLNCVSIEKFLLCGQNSLLKLVEANDGYMRTQQTWLYRRGNDNCLGCDCSLCCSHVSAVVEETLPWAASVRGTSASASASGASLIPDQQSCIRQVLVQWQSCASCISQNRELGSVSVYKIKF